MQSPNFIGRETKAQRGEILCLDLDSSENKDLGAGALFVTLGSRSEGVGRGDRKSSQYWLLLTLSPQVTRVLPARISEKV